jgi:elongation factor G
VGAEDGFQGVIDLITLQQITWDDDSLGAEFSYGQIAPDYAEAAAAARESLLETLAEGDDEFMELYLAEEQIETKTLQAAVRRATIALNLVPVLCGTALKNKGIQPLLDAICTYLPSPLDVPPISGHHPESGDTVVCHPRDKDPLAALIFKVSMIEGRKLSFARVYSGVLKAGEEVYNPTLGGKEKLSRLLRMHANKRERIDAAGAGSIIGVVGLKNTGTGETLCTSESPVVLEQIEFYEPVISVAVEPKTHADQDKLEQVLDKFLTEDPTLRVKEDPDTGQIILSGMGELHLEVIISRMQREFNTQVNVGKPQVVYRETIAKAAAGEALFDKEVAGTRHYAGVKLSLTPLPRGSETEFVSKVTSELMTEADHAAVETGILEALESGPLMGYPVKDVKAVFEAVEVREGGGSELGFKVAASMACKQALAAAGPFLLDPIMAVEIVVPEEFMGEVIGDLNARGGKIEAIDAKPQIQEIHALVPLAQMFGYSTNLRSATQGRGTFTMQFAHFDRIGNG